MTHEDFVDELSKLVAQMDDEYVRSSGFALEFESEVKLGYERKLTIRIEKDNK